MDFKAAMKSASKTVNSVLGDRCDYEHKDGSFTHGIMIFINHNKEVKGDFGILAGYNIEASILKSDVEKVSIDDKFTDDSGQHWRIVQIVKSTTSKWYVDLMEV
jgi:hypothetical protein